jgi:hypothetical protein
MEPMVVSGEDHREFRGQAGIAVGGNESLAGRNFRPNSEPRVGPVLLIAGCEFQPLDHGVELALRRVRSSRSGD